MQGIQPQRLTDKELLHYATLVPPAQLSPEWVAEILKRFAALHDARR